MTTRRWVTTGVLGVLGVGAAGWVAASVAQPPERQVLPAIVVETPTTATPVPDERATDPASPTAQSTTTALTPPSPSPASAGTPPSTEQAPARGAQGRCGQPRQPGHPGLAAESGLRPLARLRPLTGVRRLRRLMRTASSVPPRHLTCTLLSRRRQGQSAPEEE